jgi:hypothetical protein
MRLLLQEIAAIDWTCGGRMILLFYQHFQRFSIGFKFEPRDLWVGIYWTMSEDAWARFLEIYVCIIPTLPLHVVIERGKKNNDGL